MAMDIASVEEHSTDHSHLFRMYLVLFFVVLGLELRTYTFSNSTSPFL
jgi:hypothetical protein